MASVYLEPFISKNIATKRRFDTGQDRIFLAGEHVGYVLRRPRSPINLLRHDLTAEDQAEIRRAVARQHGAELREICLPPDMTALRDGDTWIENDEDGE